MNISLHIKSLLYQHDCVILPEFGAFLTQYNPAKVDVEQNVLYPPTRLIRFNEQLKTTDGLLLNHLETKLGLNHVEAQNAIKDFVEDVKLALAKKEKVTFKELGDFSIQHQGQLIFEPADTNFLVSSFGLQNLVNSPISRGAAAAPTPSVEPKVVPLPQESKGGYYKYAAVGIIAIGLASALGLNWYANDVKQHNAQVQNEVQQKVSQTIENAQFSIVEPLPSLQVSSKPVVEVKNIHIVGGAFREEANANKKLEQLRKQGFDAKLIGKNKYGLHQVSFSSFSDIEEAKTQLRKVKRNHLSSAWLLVE